MNVRLEQSSFSLLKVFHRTGSILSGLRMSLGKRNYPPLKELNELMRTTLEEKLHVKGCIATVTVEKAFNSVSTPRPTCRDAFMRKASLSKSLFKWICSVLTKLILLWLIRTWWQSRFLNKPVMNQSLTKLTSLCRNWSYFCQCFTK